jgi:hypothetical protein
LVLIKTTDYYPSKSTALYLVIQGGQFQPESGGQFEMAKGGQFILAGGGQFEWIFHTNCRKEVELRNRSLIG